jgi:hypothetical protein
MDKAVDKPERPAEAGPVVIPQGRDQPGSIGREDQVWETTIKDILPAPVRSLFWPGLLRLVMSLKRPRHSEDLTASCSPILRFASGPIPAGGS